MKNPSRDDISYAINGTNTSGFTVCLKYGSIDGQCLVD